MKRRPTDSELALLCEKYFGSTLNVRYGTMTEPELATITGPALQEFARSIGTGPDAFFESFCRLQAQQKHADRWGEKTPRHIYCLPEIFSAFPQAQVICMVRDPRAVISSYRDWSNSMTFKSEGNSEYDIAHEKNRIQQSYNIVVACLMWAGSVRAAAEGRKRFGFKRVFIQRYEDLIGNSLSSLATLMNWLSLEAKPPTSPVQVVNSSFAEGQPASGFSKDSVDRWRKRLTDRETAIIQTCCARIMRDAGYAPDPAGTSAIRLLGECLTVPFATMRATGANRPRMGSVRQYFYRRLRFGLSGVTRGADVTHGREPS